MTNRFLGPRLTVARLCLVTLLSRLQSTIPLLRLRKGREPSSGTAGGPGGSLLLLRYQSHVARSAMASRTDTTNMALSQFRCPSNYNLIMD